VTRSELSCRELVELVTDYLEGALPEAEWLRFDRHLDLCGGCRAYLAQFRAAIAAAGHVREEDVSADALDALVSSFRGWLDSGPPTTRGSV
jgi:anti-sigma factor RsiW